MNRILREPTVCIMSNSTVLVSFFPLSIPGREDSHLIGGLFTVNAARVVADWCHVAVLAESVLIWMSHYSRLGGLGLSPYPSVALKLWANRIAF